MNEFWVATSWLISVASILCCCWAVATSSNARIAIVRAQADTQRQRLDARTAKLRAEQADRMAQRAYDESQRATNHALDAKISVEAMKRSTHTIQMVPVDDAADKAMNQGIDQADEESYHGLGGLDDLEDRSGPLG
jgi:biopolymer transport protein ExbB/TolQ